MVSARGRRHALVPRADALPAHVHPDGPRPRPRARHPDEGRHRVHHRGQRDSARSSSTSATPRATCSTASASASSRARSALRPASSRTESEPMIQAGASRDPLPRGLAGLPAWGVLVPAAPLSSLVAWSPRRRRSGPSSCASSTATATRACRSCETRGSTTTSRAPSPADGRDRHARERPLRGRRRPVPRRARSRPRCPGWSPREQLRIVGWAEDGPRVYYVLIHGGKLRLAYHKGDGGARAPRGRHPDPRRSRWAPSRGRRRRRRARAHVVEATYPRPRRPTPPRRRRRPLAPRKPGGGGAAAPDGLAASHHRGRGPQEAPGASTSCSARTSSPPPSTSAARETSSSDL